MWPAHFCKNKIQIRWSTFLARIIIQLSNLLYLLPVTNGLICLVKPSSIHADVSTLNTPQIFHNGLKQKTKKYVSLQKDDEDTLSSAIVREDTERPVVVHLLKEL